MRKNKKEKIAAVVVTYNRKKLLQECLDSLLKQTMPLDSIIIVNNASTDGTEKMLRKRYLKNPIFDYVNLGENTGGAGGFRYGIKRAYEKGFDWIWCMDDDVKALPDALKKYLKYSDKYLFIQGRRLSSDGTIFRWAHSFNFKNGRKTKIDENKLFKKGEFIKVNIACFEGAFISRKIVEKIGYPLEDFFIGEDDTFYGFLVSLKTDIIYIKDITLKRNAFKKSVKIFGKKFSLFSDFSIYYLMRNKFLLEKKIKEKCKEKINHKLLIFLYFFKIIVLIIILPVKKIAMTKRLLKGFVSGIKISFS